MAQVITILQIYYKQEHKSFLDPAFIHLDNSKAAPPHVYEYKVMLDQAPKLIQENEQLFGFVSWKFNDKTKISGQEFLNFITKNSNKNHDVYFINPYPNLFYYKSVWEQATRPHPEILILTQNLLDQAGYNINLSELRTVPRVTSYCNYFVGTAQFWQNYLEFIKPLWNYINQMSQSEFDGLLKKAGNNVEGHFIPYIFERLFSTYLALHSNVKSCQYKYSFKELTKKHKILMSIMIYIAQGLPSGLEIKSHQFLRWVVDRFYNV